MVDFEVVVGAGTLRSPSEAAVRFPHRWTSEGVTVEAQFTGGHLWVLAPAGCVLNDVYREAAALDVPVSGVRVRAVGRLSEETWRSEGIRYTVDVDSTAPASAVADLLARVDVVAEIPKALRAPSAVERVPAGRAPGAGPPRDLR